MISSRILYEDNHLIAINKKSSEIVQGDKTGDKTLPDYIKEYLKTKFNKPGNVFCGVIHRLDRPTSGVLLFARTSKGLSRMNKQFKDKAIKKTYWAILENRPEKKNDRLVHFLKKNVQVLLRLRECLPLILLLNYFGHFGFHKQLKKMVKPNL